jgi:hypothetical protein
MLTDFAKVCEGIGKVERGVERVGGMVGDVDDDVAFRGVVCVGNLIGNGGGDIKTHVLEIGMGEKVKAFLGRTGDERMKGLCREVLASFVA